MELCGVAVTRAKRTKRVYAESSRLKRGRLAQSPAPGAELPRGPVECKLDEPDEPSALLDPASDDDGGGGGGGGAPDYCPPDDIDGDTAFLLDDPRNYLPSLGPSVAPAGDAEQHSSRTISTRLGGNVVGNKSTGIEDQSHAEVDDEDNTLEDVDHDKDDGIINANEVHDIHHTLSQLRNSEKVGHTAIWLLLRRLMPLESHLIEVISEHIPSWETWAIGRRYHTAPHNLGVFVPLFQPARTHWVLLYLDLEQKRATLHDSLSDDFHPMEPAARALVKTIGGDWQAEGWQYRADLWTPQQKDSRTCGLRVVLACLHLATNVRQPADIDVGLWERIFRAAVGDGNALIFDSGDPPSAEPTSAIDAHARSLERYRILDRMVRQAEHAVVVVSALAIKAATNSTASEDMHKALRSSISGRERALADLEQASRAEECAEDVGTLDVLRATIAAKRDARGALTGREGKAKSRRAAMEGLWRAVDALREAASRSRDVAERDVEARTDSLRRLAFGLLHNGALGGSL
ncbi:hypothetical protein SLS56_011159 [Neofusicoccum ribis]|uniref:Ubiquitin-like protease family profile domain-containing protein n=1 Tax=Neofusicoccum ribis TaxID=45134 RepID=A0ABR3SCZ1_9PEZI